MIIKILGTGCPKCKLLEKTVEEATKKIELDCTIVKVHDMEEITKYDIMSMPGLVIDDILIFSGGVPEADEIVDILTHFQSGASCCGGGGTCGEDGACCGGCSCE